MDKLSNKFMHNGMDTFIINNANIITPTEVISGGNLVVKNDKIAEIGRAPYSGNENKYQVINAHGSYLMPGIIDIHTDAMDFEINPRSSADFPVDVAFSELEKRMCGVGITTVFHSLHLGYIDAEFQMKSKYSRKQIFEEVWYASKQNTMIHNKIHLRYEISGTDDYELCFEFIEKGYVDLFSFMDHTPGQGQYPIDKFLAVLQKRGLTIEQALAEYDRKTSRPRISKEKILELTRFLRSKNIPVASHDDDSPYKVEENHLNEINICEFPITMETAKRATELNMSVVGGASNILRGGSTGGNLNARDAISNGFMNTLCSDYYPPAILHSIFMLFEQKVLSLPEAVKLATLNAAKAVNLDQITGSIEVGKVADLVMINYLNNFPTVVKSIAAGNISSKFSLKPEKVLEYSN
jgi:alpha-D-ribose 1-methylphosphonate 5-triphosphate diphosphatase